MHTYTHSHAQPIWGSFASSPFSLSSSHFLGEKALVSSRPGVARAVVERAAAMSHGLPSHAPHPCTFPSEALSIVSHSVQPSAAVQIPWVDEIALPIPLIIYAHDLWPGQFPSWWVNGLPQPLHPPLSLTYCSCFGLVDIPFYCTIFN